MPSPLAIDADGQRLTAFERGSEIVAREHRGVPCPLALVVLAAHGHVLLGRNRWRRSWELPGGMLEPEESPRAAASRELHEETGVQIPADDLDWAGLATFELANPSRTELAAVFVVRLDEQIPVQASDELVELGWFRLEDPPAEHSPLDIAAAAEALERSRG